MLEFLKDIKRQKEEAFNKACVSMYRKNQTERNPAVFDGQLLLLDELIKFFKKNE